MLRRIASRGSVTCSFAPRDSVPGTRAGGQNHFRIPVAGAFFSSLLAVSFQEVVHSGRTVKADVAKPQ
jgi:hypothetical protein